VGLLIFLLLVLLFFGGWPTWGYHPRPDLNVLPRPAMNDVTDDRVVYPVGGPKPCQAGVACRVEGADLKYLVFRQLGRVNGPAPTVSPFAHLVVRVVAVAAEKQMVGTDAARVVAAVKDASAGRHGAADVLVGEAVGSDGLTVRPNHAVTLGANPPPPSPTAGALSDAAPETLGRLSGAERRPAGPAAKARRPVGEPGRLYSKTFSALATTDGECGGDGGHDRPSCRSVVWAGRLLPASPPCSMEITGKGDISPGRVVTWAFCC
jgi:hypothetical protein